MLFRSSEGKIEEMKKVLGEALLVVPGLDDSLIGYLFKLGYHSPDNLLNAHMEDLAGIPGISEDMAMQIQQIAFEVKKKRDEEMRIAKEQAAQAAALAAVQAEQAAAAVGAERKAVADQQDLLEKMVLTLPERSAEVREQVSILQFRQDELARKQRALEELAEELRQKARQKRK